MRGMKKNIIVSVVVVMEILFSILLVGFTTFHTGVDIRAYQETLISYPDDHNATNLSFTRDSAGILYSAWDEFDESTGHLQVHISVSKDDGSTWSGAARDIIVTNGEQYDAKQPSILGGRESTVYLAWTQLSSSGTQEIFFRKSNDTGNSWSNVVQVTRSSTDGKEFTHPMLANDSHDILYGAWNGIDPNNGDHQEVYFGYSRDYGDQWSSMESTICISNESIKSDSSKPFILVSSNDEIFVFWTKYLYHFNSTEVFVSYSKDGGNSWIIENVSYTDYDTNAYNVSAVEYGGKIYAFWEQEVPEKYRLVREVAFSYFDGQSWSGTHGDSFISYPDGYNATNPSACESSTHMMVVWSEFDERNGHKQLMISNSTDGSTWSGRDEDIALTDSTSDHLIPISLVANGNLHVVWSMWYSNGKPRGSREIFTLTAPQVPELPNTLIFPAVFSLIAFTLKRKRLLR